MLNYKEIQRRNLIQYAHLNNYKNASYDLRVEKIITIEGKELTSYEICPNSMAVAISMEKVQLPKDIIGHAYVKTRLSQHGIMANNIGLIDTEYEGQLSSVLVNFGKSNYKIQVGDVFLRVTFTQISLPTPSIPIGYGPFLRETYLNLRKSDSMSYLGNSFVNIDKVTQAAKKEIKKSFTKMFTQVGLWVAVIGLLVNIVLSGISLNNDRKEKIKKDKVEGFEKQMKSINDGQTLIINNQSELESKILSLEKDIDSISAKNRELNKLLDL